MDKPKKQHWVSKFYLEYFAIPDTINTKNPQVWFFTKEEGESLRASVKDVCTRRYLYSPLSDEGKRCWEMEEKLADVEALLAPIWPSLASDVVDLGLEPLREALSLFVAIQLVRTPIVLEKTQEIHQRIVDMIESYPKDSRGRPLLDQVVINGQARPFDFDSFLEYKNASQSAIKQSFVQAIQPTAGEISKVLLGKRMSIILSDTPVFITTDHPVAYFSRDPYRLVYGVNSADTSLIFPISPTRLLLFDDMYDEPANQYYPLEKELIAD